MSASIPDNVVASNGVGVFSDSQANTWVQGGATLATLRAFNNALSNMTCYMLGYATAGDGGAGSFWWNPASTAADDGGVTTIQPNGIVTGRWLRDDPVVSGGSQQWNAGTVTAIGTNLSISGGTLNASGSLGVVTVVAGTGLQGGTITSSGTIELGTIGAGKLFGNPGTVGAIGQDITVGAGLTLSGSMLTSSSGEWSAGTVSALALGLTISGTTLTPPSAALGLGTYVWALYHASATPVLGTTYAGSTLYNAATGATYSASGTWRCMGPDNPYAVVCCVPNYSKTLFLRVG